MIRAKGKKNGKDITVYYENNIFLFDGEENENYYLQVEEELQKNHPIGGTYYAEKYNDPLNIINVLSNHFFDRPTLDIVVKGKEAEAVLPDEDNDKKKLY